MPVILDAKQNPIVRIYQLFSRPEVEARDGPRFLGLANLSLTAFGGAESRALVQFLRQTGALDSCRLVLAGQPLLNFASDLVTEWFEWETIADLARQGRLSPAAYDTLFYRQEQLEQYTLDHYWPPGGDPVADCLLVLDELAASDEVQDNLTLEFMLAKRELVGQYLLGTQNGWAGNVSGLLWYSPERMRQAFDEFHEFLRYIARAAHRPLIFFFFEPTAPYPGDFCKILSLNPATGQEELLLEQLQSFTAPRLAEYAELRIRHKHENRPNIGERFDLSPALLLRQGELPATYPGHPLFTTGPLRPVLLYTLLAWLAEKTEYQAGTLSFTWPAAAGSPAVVTLRFSLADIQQQAARLFEAEPAWPERILLLAYDIQRSAGRKRLRALWQEALAAEPAESFTAGNFFAGLERVRTRFNRLEQRPLDVSDASPDLEVRVFLDKKAEGDRLKFELHSATRLSFFHKDAGDTPLGTDNPDQRFHDLNALAKQYLSRILQWGAPDAAAALPDIRKLESQGRELWTELIPADLKRDYIRFRQEQDLAMLIVSTDPAFPWELVRPYAKKGALGPERIDDLWWALQFSLARWLAGSRPPASTLGLKRVCCVATTAQLASTLAEVEYFQNSSDFHLDRPTGKAELLDLLSSTGYDVIHFACHGRFDTDQPGESVVQLPDRSLLRPGDLYGPAIEEMIGEHRPLIFLNACHSGRTGPAITGLGGWAERLIDMECGAFIGCGWEVADPLAAEFATTFYDMFKQSKELGQAVHLARQTIRQKSPENSTWLAYYLYGNPRCRLRREG